MTKMAEEYHEQNQRASPASSLQSSPSICTNRPPIISAAGVTAGIGGNVHVPRQPDGKLMAIAGQQVHSSKLGTPCSTKGFTNSPTQSSAE